MMSGGPGGGVASSGCSSNNSCGNSSQDVDNAVQQQQQQQQHLAAVRSVAGLTSSTSNVMTLNSPLHQHLSVRISNISTATKIPRKRKNKNGCVFLRPWPINSKMEWRLHYSGPWQPPLLPPLSIILPCFH